MAFTKVDHVAMLVDDLEVGRRVFCDGWGLAVDELRSPWPQGRPGTFEGVTSIEIPIGELYLEISRPNDPGSAAGRFVAERRAGMYHIALASNELAADVDGLLARGARLEGPWDGRGAVFLDPATTLGLRIRIVPDQGYYAHPAYRGDGTFTGMGHIGIAARDAGEVRALFGGVFGLHEDRSAERGQEPGPERAAAERRDADDPVHLLEFPLGGTVIEVSIPTTTDSGTARLVATRAPLGAVYHHICPYAPDVWLSAERGRAAGLQQIGTTPPRDPAHPERVDVAWFHPRTCAGTLIEIWNRPPGREHAEQWRRLHA
jgi:catechol 2,3-dioxygenase-like lactoylglutathione lyase family enzyme